MVSELIDAVLLTESLKPVSEINAAVISSEVFRYKNDETLIIYNTAEKSRMDLLKPFHTAQVCGGGFDFYLFISKLQLIY